MTEKDLEIQELRRKVKRLEEEKQFIIDYINKECVYDKHLMGYCMGLTPGKVRTLMYKIKEDNNGRK